MVRPRTRSMTSAVSYFGFEHAIDDWVADIIAGATDMAMQQFGVAGSTFELVSQVCERSDL
jgi:hypothetical protein